MKKIFFLAAASLILTACDKNDDNPISSDTAVKISATIGGDYTTRAKDNQWSAGDKIGITATSGHAVGRFVNMKYEKSDAGNGFTGNPIYFYNPMTLSAYYPFYGEEGKAPGTEEGIIERDTRAANQTSDNQPGIDFLYAGDTEIDIIDNKPVINFSFNHKMSKLTLIFEKGNEGTDISKIVSYTIDGLVLDGTFDTVNGVCAVKEGAAAESLTINLSEADIVNKETVAVAPLIIFPQIVEKVTIRIHDNEEQDYVGTLSFDNNSIEEGKNYQFNITVSKTGLTVNFGINDWDTITSEDNSAESAD